MPMFAMITALLNATLHRSESAEHHGLSHPATAVHATSAASGLHADPAFCSRQGTAGASEDSFVSQALLPESNTPDLLDYSLAWHLHSTLAAAGLWQSSEPPEQVHTAQRRGVLGLG